jgi:hypothetical protein
MDKCTDKKEDCTVIPGYPGTFVDTDTDCYIADAVGFVGGFAEGCLGSETMSKTQGCALAVAEEALLLVGDPLRPEEIGAFQAVSAAVYEWVNGPVVPAPTPAPMCSVPTPAPTPNCLQPADWWEGAKCAFNAIHAAAVQLEEVVVSCVPEQVAENALKMVAIALTPGAEEAVVFCKVLEHFVPIAEKGRDFVLAVDDGNWFLAGQAFAELLGLIVAEWPCPAEHARPAMLPISATQLPGSNASLRLSVDGR